MPPHREASERYARMRVQNYCFFLTWQWVVPDVVQSVSADFQSPHAQPILWTISALTTILRMLMKVRPESLQAT